MPLNGSDKSTFKIRTTPIKGLFFRWKIWVGKWVKLVEISRSELKWVFYFVEMG